MPRVKDTYKPRKNAVLMLMQGNVAAGITLDTRQLWTAEKHTSSWVFRRECVAISIPMEDVNQYFVPVISNGKPVISNDKKR